MEPQDRELARRWQRGETAAGELAAQRYAATLGAIACSITRDVSLAEDVVQETFVRAAKNIHGLRDGEKLGSFLMTIARNTARDMARVRRREESLSRRPDRGGEDGGATVERRERANALRLAIAALPDDQQELIHLKYTAAKRYRDIAQELGMSEDAVAQKLWRIRRKLQEALKEFQS